jgi:hypothetical protein
MDLLVKKITNLNLPVRTTPVSLNLRRLGGAFHVRHDEGSNRKNRIRL